MTETMQLDQYQMKEQEKIRNGERERVAKHKVGISPKQQEAEISYVQAKPMLDAPDEAVAKIKTPLHRSTNSPTTPHSMTRSRPPLRR